MTSSDYNPNDYDDADWTNIPTSRKAVSARLHHHRTFTDRYVAPVLVVAVFVAMAVALVVGIYAAAS